MSTILVAIIALFLLRRLWKQIKRFFIKEPDQAPANEQMPRAPKKESKVREEKEKTLEEELLDKNGRRLYREQGTMKTMTLSSPKWDKESQALVEDIHKRMLDDKFTAKEQGLLKELSDKKDVFLLEKNEKGDMLFTYDGQLVFSITRDPNNLFVDITEYPFELKKGMDGENVKRLLEVKDRFHQECTMEGIKPSVNLTRDLSDLMMSESNVAKIKSALIPQMRALEEKQYHEKPAEKTEQEKHDRIREKSFEDVKTVKKEGEEKGFDSLSLNDAVASLKRDGDALGQMTRIERTYMMAGGADKCKGYSVSSVNDPETNQNIMIVSHNGQIIAQAEIYKDDENKSLVEFHTFPYKRSNGELAETVKGIQEFQERFISGDMNNAYEAIRDVVYSEDNVVLLKETLTPVIKEDRKLKMEKMREKQQENGEGRGPKKEVPQKKAPSKKPDDTTRSSKKSTKLGKGTLAM